MTHPSLQACLFVPRPAQVGLAAALLAAALGCQELRVRDASPCIAAAFDPTRDRMVALGARGETLEWDRQLWRRRPAPLVGGLAGAKMVYDGARERIVMLQVDVGATSTTMAYDGRAWQALQPAVSPPPRFGHGLVYDAGRDEVVLFGGLPYSPTQALDDTWVFDGTSWQQRFPPYDPWPRHSVGMSYDAARARTVMFGGVTYPSFARLHETWEWDGTSWVQIHLPSTPTPSLGLAMAYDAARNRTVLVAESPSGSWDDVWEYDGSGWLAVAAPSPAPSSRNASTLVFDGGSGECALVGGTGAHFVPPDLWTWNGTRWLSVSSPPAKPSSFGRDSTLLAPTGDGLVHLEQSAGNPSVTWTFDGWSWSVVPVATPLSRFDASTATGPSYAYLYGGNDLNQPNAPFVADLWGWNGTSWTGLASQGPVAGPGAAIGYDWARVELVLFGGSDATNTILDETWVFGGTSWQQRFPATNPPPLAGAGMAFDPLRGVLVMHRGTSFYGPNGTWEWNGIDWSPAAAATSPTGFDAIAFDAQRGQVVGVREAVLGPGPQFMAWNGTTWAALPIVGLPLYGPRPFGFPYLRGTLIVDDRNVFSSSTNASEAAEYGSSCSAAAPLVTANEWPTLGAVGFAIEIARAPANSFAALLGAVSSASVNVGGCVQLVQPGQAVALMPTSSIGFAAAQVPIPSNAAFVGTALYFQAAALDPSAPNGFTLSSGLRITIGD